ncbi:2-hydroxyacyl-CoA dehydratase [Sedimentibacter sp. zth1]|uniref:2-hydroxyacyl-CoA dehydratase n=1 Tax=Sedimentibacter sp. zth1 TaxID=2816908 RepID=UPI001A91B393|nr:2-hydroxyacyl-CoA dehydratase [Sedimentibacter sp. zth1]QSX05568.1 2-hydroxyacyl-CoA dehydratase [Sedimentibacter sp. zth1]
MASFKIGLDIGSTTVKIAILDGNNNIVHKEYKRHYSDIKSTVLEIINNSKVHLKNKEIRITLTGSGAVDVAKFFDITFVQEVVACTRAVEEYIPETDVAIELGGEDAKITYFKGNLEQRMNGSCAGGTGAFIDQMAILLKTDANGLNELSKSHKVIYPIASRCGVFAKTDIQPLLNEGARQEDIAASIFQAVVNQTISGLAQGRPIKGNIAFLGGPLYFLPELRKRFIETLNLKDNEIICPEYANYYVAFGAALCAEEVEETSFNDFYEKTKANATNSNNLDKQTLNPLFSDKKDYDEFINRHNKNKAKTKSINSYNGKAYLGIDAGSTTTKIVLITEHGEILYTYYGSNEGNPLKSTINALKDMHTKLHDGIKVCYSTVTGYGEHLIKAALKVDLGEIETIAHYKAANFFLNDVNFILDIGGQDMKCMRVKNGVIDSIMLNEACSSGCGSFIETFAKSLNMSVKDFAQEGTLSKNPVDLGTRCTVFMNSKVKQAQREGATLKDISAGISFSVIKNALFKVIRLKNSDSLGEKVVVQGGTFYNNTVLRAFEIITGKQAIRPDIAGLMGAFGAAIVAKEKYRDNFTSTLINLSELESFTFETTMERCGKCGNNCLLTVNKFPDQSYYISGNRCERGAEKYIHIEKKKEIPNLYKYKYKRLFDYTPLSMNNAPRGIIGIPRVLNIYEDYPFWFTFFTNLGYRVVLSGKSTRKIYELGMESIPSESVCYPGKISHGHVMDLINKKITKIFYPCISYAIQEDKEAGNHYNCPVVTSYPETISANVDMSDITFYKPFLNLNEKDRVIINLTKTFKNENISEDEITNAVNKAYDELNNYKQDVVNEGNKALEYIEKNNCKGIVLCGRPYHIDPEINHGIPEMIESYGLVVLSEDSIREKAHIQRPLRVIDQWTYHTRLYAAASFVTKSQNLELIQLNSFGCGLDAVTTDQVNEILEENNKIYTLIKIDEINNLGAIRIRIRSLIASIADRKNKHIENIDKKQVKPKAIFTKEMRKTHTILVPQMSPIHFQFVNTAAKKSGYNFEVLPSVDRDAINEGLKYVNNDACYPSIIVTGQMINAIKSGKYDLHNTSLLISQTGGGCRATNYIAFIRKALSDMGLDYIPVISANLVGLDKQPGFKFTIPFINRMILGIVIGDLLMRVTYRTRPYEVVKGSVNKLYDSWVIKCNKVVESGSFAAYKKAVSGIVKDFSEIAINENIVKPRVGVVGEILVKFHPTANNNVYGLLEDEGAEVIVPDLIDFALYSALNGVIKYDNNIYGTKKARTKNNLALKAIEMYKRPLVKELSKSDRFTTPSSIEEIAGKAKNFLSLCNQCGEGWLLTGEMLELLDSGVDNILCLQPFACLPNHITGKGMIKKLKDNYSKSNIVAIDYDAGSSEVNQINRIKLMLTTARRTLKKKATEEA